MNHHRGTLAYQPCLPWCCLLTLPVLFVSSLVFLEPLADLAGLLVISSWLFAGLQFLRQRHGDRLSRSMGFSITACLIATIFHFGVLAMTSQDCVVTKGLGFLYWQAFVSPDAWFSCSWCNL